MVIIHPLYVIPPRLRTYLEHLLGALGLCTLAALEVYLGNPDVALVSMLLAIPISSPDRWDRFSWWVQGLVYRNQAAREWATSRRLQRVRQFRYANERVSRVLTWSWSGQPQGVIAQPRRLVCLARPRRGMRVGRRSRRAGQGGTRSSGQESDGGEGGPDGPPDTAAAVAAYHDQRNDPSILSWKLTGCSGRFVYSGELAHQASPCERERSG